MRFRAALLFVEHSAGRGIQEKPGSAMIGVEVEQSVQRASNRVRGTIADTAQTPVVFDKAKDGRLVGHAMIHVIPPCEGRNRQKRLTWTISATPVLDCSVRVDGFRRSTVTSSKELVIGHVGLVHDRTHHMVVPAVGVVVQNDYGGFLPLV